MSELASPGQLRMSFLRVVMVIVPLVLLLGLLSGAVAGSGLSNPWFARLVKPAAMPPAWLFPAAWTILYILIGLALAMVVAARGSSGRGLAVGLWIVQFLLNLAWSPVFFAAHRPDIAFAVILLMILATIACILSFARIRPRAALLMLPYLAWLCFAAWLNHSIEVLNPGATMLAPAAASTQVQL